MVLVKEYRIPLPLTVEEYRVAQLYMIAKKSRQESHGEGSGVEILVNEPYTDGPGPEGKGQYTHKVYHVGSHLPGWLKSLIPKSALSVEEEAWNAYPYTKTRFTCPFVEKFSIEVETYYYNDGGQQENVFNLSKSEMKQREIDLIDVVKDQLYGADYVEEEDPRKYISQKTNRGPLGDNWIEEYSEMCNGKNAPLPNGQAIMCAYKLCKVEFRYWGMQTKIEKFIHDIALRKTMLRAHRQAWAWMDEWWGLTIEDIRNIEKETQSLLAKKYGQGGEEDGAQNSATAEVSSGVPHSPSVSSDRTPNLEQLSKCSSFRTSNDLGDHSQVICEGDVVANNGVNSNNNNNNESEENLSGLGSSPKLKRRELNVSLDSVLVDDTRKRGSWSRSGSRNTLNSQNQASWRMESIRRDSDSSGSEDEFFDCQAEWVTKGTMKLTEPTPFHQQYSVPASFQFEDLEETAALHKWSSLELLPPDGDTQSTAGHAGNEDSIFSPAFISRVAAERHSRVLGRSMETSAPSSPSHSPSHQPGPCSTTVLLLVIHAGSVLDPTPDVTNKRSDVTTFRGAFESVMRQHYPHMVGHVAIRLVSAPPVCSDSLNILSSLSPYGLDATPVCGEVSGGDSVPVGAVPLLATSVPEYDEYVVRTLNSTNAAYHEFLRSEEGHGFNGQVCIIGDSIGGVLAYDVLCRVHDQQKYGSNSNIPEGEPPSPGQYYKQKSSPAQPQSSSPSPATPPSISPDKPVSSPPLTTLSPTITVSLESTLVKPTTGVFVQAAESASPKNLNTASSSHSPSDKIPSPQSTNNLHSPLRKISAPLPPSGFSPLTRKCSAPCSIPSGAGMWGCQPGSSTPTPSPPGPTSSSSSSTSPSGLCHSHNLLCQCHNPVHRSHHHHGVSCAHDSLIPGPLWERRGDEIGDNTRVYRKSISSDAPHHTDVPHSRSVSDSDYHYARHLSAPYPRRRSSSSSDHAHSKLDFEVSDFFTFGCPLALVLVYRKMVNTSDKNSTVQRPACQQVYNLFHPTDPLAVRVEPLISARFSLLPPITIPRYTKYPLGDGLPTHLLECIQSNGSVFMDLSGTTGSPSLTEHTRRMSDASILSTVSGMGDTVPLATINALSQRWWGTKRLDYALYCPEGLANFPTNSLPHLFHASYWESSDVIAFILRQLVRTEHAAYQGDDKDLPVFSPTQPREKWMKKRTSVKIKNVAANHRGNDVIVREGAPQSIQARFMYGPLDMVALSGEKVDIHIMRDPPGGEWQQISTEVTDKNGRIAFTVPPDKALSCGMYPVKMVVRGDHTSSTLYLTIVPPKTECVVFSIDGSFTASVSVTGRDPKVRAGAVDVVRHWQELGYLIIYVTGRPDMQQQKVVSWLAQHNFPHGLVSFADGLSRDPLGHKADYLRGLIQDHALQIGAAYGSAKDIAVYSSIGLKPEQIFIVGKASKKQQANAQVLTDGYAAHLSSLSALGKSRPAKGNPQMVIPRGFFGLPGQHNALRRRRSAKRTTSFPVRVASASEGVMRSRGSSQSRPNHMSMRC
ncbi:protein retinal degeneration B-like isoform X1 [Portunus trituberculatus]|uniref:protein retinal degeneration B-like isoform X1 n=1 Tax=Portunus trituberculatus TaxID=210409 RepID=UPI001E1D12E7|nr:protein retinal degeneration B-like isoform X1 [Portunus trituberculatus]XP_045127105.1 protein retinal degeneration B-like isoform X1 [Portunus trituberculatus]XP_045127106.1 protein retinal degeneration B-like isoform X1 [Portunus trituberculatus]